MYFIVNHSLAWLIWDNLDVCRQISLIHPRCCSAYKWSIYRFTKWQIHPFISKGAKCRAISERNMVCFTTVAKFPEPSENHTLDRYLCKPGGGPRVVVSTADFHARVQGSFPGLGGLKETKTCLPHLLAKLSIVRSLRDREVACSSSDLQGLNFESFVWRAVSYHSSHNPQEVLLAQFSLYVHKRGQKSDSFHFIYANRIERPADMCTMTYANDIIITY